MSKGKRVLEFQLNDIKVSSYDLEKKVYQILKTKGVKYSDTIEMYVNLVDRNVYCVVNDETIVIALNEVL